MGFSVKGVEGKVKGVGGKVKGVGFTENAAPGCEMDRLVKAATPVVGFGCRV